MVGKASDSGRSRRLRRRLFRLLGVSFLLLLRSWVQEAYLIKLMSSIFSQPQEAEAKNRSNHPRSQEKPKKCGASPRPTDGAKKIGKKVNSQITILVFHQPATTLATGTPCAEEILLLPTKVDLVVLSVGMVLSSSKWDCAVTIEYWFDCYWMNL